MDEAGWVEDSMMERVLMREDGDKIEVVDIVEVMDGTGGSQNEVRIVRAGHIVTFW